MSGWSMMNPDFKPDEQEPLCCSLCGEESGSTLEDGFFITRNDAEYHLCGECLREITETLELS